MRNTKSKGKRRSRRSKRRRLLENGIPSLAEKFDMMPKTRSRSKKNPKMV